MATLIAPKKIVQIGVSCALSPEGVPDTESFKINAGGNGLGRVASVLTMATAMVLSQLTQEPYTRFVSLLADEVKKINESKEKKENVGGTEERKEEV